MLPAYTEIRGHIFAAYHQMVRFSRVSRVSGVSRVTIRVSVRIRVRFSFIGAILYIAMTQPNIGAANISP